MTAHLTYCLVGLGLRESRTVKTALDFILTNQRKDGGWHCETLKQNGEKDELLPSCPAASVHVLRLLGLFTKKYHLIIQGALPGIYSFLNSSISFSCLYQLEKSLNLKKLRYPPHFTGLDILNIFDCLSAFPDLLDKKFITGIANEILRRWDGDHFLSAEKRIASWAAFDFAHNNQSSDWITAIFISSLQRLFLK
jgi:hypothetical protein